MKNIFIALLFLGSLLIGITSSYSPAFTRIFFVSGSYYILLFLFLTWVGVALWGAKQASVSFKSLWAEDGPVLLLISGLLLVIFLSVPVLFKVLSDETNLLSVARGLAFEHKAHHVTMGKVYFHTFFPLTEEISKKPLLFPFLISLLHTLTGYRVENAFVLNFLVLFGVFSVGARIARDFGGKVAAWLAVLFLGSQPLLTQVATSGSFDLLFVFFLMISFYALHLYLKQASAWSFAWLWLNLLMLAHTRHEGPIVFGIVVIALVFMRMLDPGHLKPKWIYALTPLFLLPRIWHHLLREGAADVFETGGGAPFSLKYLADHTIDFLQRLVDFGLFFPVNPVLNVLGLIALLYFLMKWFRSVKQHKHSIRLFFLSTLCVGFYSVIVLSFHMGSFNEPASSRYYMIHFVILSLLSVQFLTELWRRWKLPERTVLMVGLATFFIFHPQSVEGKFSNWMTLTREYRYEMEFLRELDQEDILIISERPSQFVVARYGAVSFGYANHKKMELMTDLLRNTVDAIYVFQEILYQTNQPTTETTLDREFKLETVSEWQHSTESYTRISKVLL